MLILELTKKECVEMLTRLRFGRLGCSRDNQPYIVPFNFAYHEQYLYSVAALGQKIEWMRTNPLVCVEADEIVDHNHWTSVVVQGRYEEWPDTPEWSAERELAFALLQRRVMWWEPACVKATHLGAVEQVIVMYYRIHIDRVTGRRAKPDPVEAVALLEPATTSRSKGWLKRLRRRTPPASPNSAASRATAEAIARKHAVQFESAMLETVGGGSPISSLNKRSNGQRT